MFVLSHWLLLLPSHVVLFLLSLLLLSFSSSSFSSSPSPPLPFLSPLVSLQPGAEGDHLYSGGCGWTAACLHGTEGTIVVSFYTPLLTHPHIPSHTLTHPHTPSHILTHPHTPSHTLTSSHTLTHPHQIFMWHFKDNKDLVGVAFIDTEVYIHHATAIKNFILIADVTRSIQLLRYQVFVRLKYS